MGQIRLINNKSTIERFPLQVEEVMKKLKKGYKLKGKPRNYDTTATLAKLMQLKTPTCWEGVCIDEILSNGQ